MTDVILEYFSRDGGLLGVFLVSMMPIIELRGAVPFGVGLGHNGLLVYIISVIGNMLPVPFIILFIRPIIEWLIKTKYFAKLGLWLEERTMKNKDKITKYKKLGLYIFVAIPLPGTGAWTGAMLAGLMDMRLKDALPAVLLGVMTAGVIMLLISYGIGGVLNIFA